MNYAGHTPEDVGSATHLCLRIHIAGKPRHETRDSNDSFKAECPSLRDFSEGGQRGCLQRRREASFGCGQF